MAWFVDDACPTRERAKLPPNLSIAFNLDFAEDEPSPLPPLTEMLEIWIEATRCKDRWVDILLLDLSILAEDAHPLNWERLKKTQLRWIIPYVPKPHGEEWYSETEMELLQDVSLLFED